MQDLNDSGDDNVKPKTVTFSAVINAWARSNNRVAADGAEAILNRMQELFEAGNHDVKPNGRIRCPNLTGPVLELENLEFVTVVFHVKLVGIPRSGLVQSLLQRVDLIMVWLQFLDTSGSRV